MASPHLLYFFSFILLLTTTTQSTHTPKPTPTPTHKPSNLVLPIQKDTTTNLFITKINKKTPNSQTTPLLLDINGKYLWITSCNTGLLSSTFHAPLCHSTQCTRANTPFCHTNNTCGLMAVNPITSQTIMGSLIQDDLSIQPMKPGTTSMMTIPHFLFGCAPSTIGLPKNVQGVAGFGHAPISLPTQVSSYLGLTPTFSLCLPSMANKNGVVLFGTPSKNMFPNLDVSRSLSYTPLTNNEQGHYFIGVTSIRINNKLVPLNKNILQGGARISTTQPFTVLERSIFQSLTKFFINELSSYGSKPVMMKPVAPFGVCFDSRKLSTRVVPDVDLVLHKQNVKWTISGANLMVQPRAGVSCLAFVDGGLKPKSGSNVVLGAYQLQDNFVQFDLARSSLGFSNSLLLHRTSCANFNFSSTP